MAKYGKTLAQVTVEINGKKQAEQVLKAMTTAAAEMRNSIRSAKNELEQLALAGGGPAYDAKKKEVLGMEKELKQLERSIRETKKFSEDVGSILDNMSKNSATTLTRTKRALESLLSSIVPSTKKAQKQIEFLQKAIKQVTDEIARRKGQLTEFDDIMGNLGKATPKQLDAVEKRLQSLLDSVTKNSSAWRKYNKELRIVQDEKASRKKSEMESQMENVAKLSVSARNELKKYWQSVNDGAKQGSKSFRESLKNLQEIDRVETEMATKQAKKVLSAPKKYSVGEINDAIKVAEQMQTDTKSKKEWADLAEQIAKAKEVRDSFADSAKLKVMSEQFKNVKDLSFNAFAEQKKYWTEIKNSLTESDPLYKKAIANLEQMDKIETDRMKQQSTETLTANLNKAGTSDIKQAVDWLTKYQATLEPLSKEWLDINDLITAGNDRLKQLTDTIKREAMEKQFGDLKDLSANALAEQLKYWEGIRDNAKATDADYKTAIDNIKQIKDLTDSRTLRSSTDTLTTNLNTSGTADIKQAVDWLTKYQATLEPLSKEWLDINDLITAGNDRLKQLTDTIKREAMEKQFGDLKDLSANALAEQLKYWEGIRDNAKATDADYKTAIDNIKQIKDLTDSRTLRSSTDTLTTNLNTSGTADIKQAVDWLTKYQSTLEPLSKEWQGINDLITAGNDRLKDISDTAKFNAMNQQFANLRSLSKSALAEQKKYWQSLFDSLDVTDSKFATARDNLDEIKDWEKLNIDRSAIPYINNAISGSWDKTIEETEEAIKLIQEYKKQLKTETDAPLIQEANEAIEILNRNLGKAKEALMDIQDAKRIAQKVSEGSFNGTAEDIEKAKKALEEYRKTLKLSGEASEVEKVDRMLNNLARSAELGGKNLKDLDAVLEDLKHASMDDLQTAAKQLQQELQGATRSTEDYVKTAEKLRRVNRELEHTRQEWEGQESLFVRMTRRLSVYMAAYGSLSFIVDKVKELGQSNLQLSDSIADVAKTTGLEADELAKLGKEIRAIDTRTAQEQLYELAAAAGQLGLKSETEIAGFVRAANMITVSLNELGTEATTQLMKIATLTGEAQEGTETALLSIGSAINELTASSAAAAGPIVDLMNRMGGIAAQSGITSAQMAAIGATADALGQSVEITGTSMNKFLATLMSSSNQIAYALNMDAKALRSLLNEGRTMDAVIAVFEKMNQMGGLGALAPIMGELGSEGARMTQVLAAMAEKVDFLKGQLDISTKAYEEAISIQNEYNVKNENAIAILQRMGNAIKEFFVNNVAVDVITAVLRVMYQFFSYLGQGTTGAKMLASSLALLATALISTRIQWVRTVNEMSRVDVFRNVLLWLKNLTTGTISLTTAWKNLGKVLKTNWFSLLIGAVAALGTWIYKTATYVSEAAKATAKYNRELQEEKDKVDQLFNSLKRLGNTEADRARIINSINQQYGQYLGFMLDEKDSAEKLAAAHQLINAELRKRMALNLQNTLTGKAQNDYSTELEKTIADIGTKIENTRVRITKKNGGTEDRELYTTDVMDTVSEMINDRVYESVKVTQEEVNGQIVHRQQMGSVDLDKLKEDIKNTLKKQFEDVQRIDKEGNVLQEKNVGGNIYAQVESYIEDLLEGRIAYQKKIIDAENQANIELRSATKAVLKQRENINEELTTEIKNAQNDSENLEANLQAADKALKAAEAAAEKYGKDDKSKEAKDARKNLTKAQQNYAAEEKALKDHYKKIADNAYDYIDNQQEILKEHYANVDSIKDENLRKQKEAERDAINAQIDEYTNIAKEAAKKVPGFDPWGKGRDVKDWKEFKEIVENIDTSSAYGLAAAYKKIKDETAWIGFDTESFFNMFDTAIDKDLKLTDPEAIAKQVHRWAEQIKEKLKTKYGRNTSLGFIFENEGGKKQKDEIEAALASLEAYYNERESVIRQNALLEESTQEELDKHLRALEQEHLSARIELRKFMAGKENEFFTEAFEGPRTSEYMADIDYTKVLAEVERGGKAARQKLEKDLTADMATYQKLVWEYSEEISRILLENDPVKKVALEYQKSFEKIDLFWSADETRTKDAAREKMATLLEFSAKRAELTDEELKEQLKKSKEFGDVVKGMLPQEYQAFLILLDQYAEAATSAKRQATQRAIRNLEFSFDNSDMGKQVSGQLQNIDELEKQLGELNSAGIMLEASSLEQQRELVMQRIFLEQYKWEEMIKAEQNGMNRQDVLRELQLQKEKAQYESRVELVKLISQQDENMFNESNQRIEQMVSWGVISDIEGTERQQELVRAQLALQQERIDEQIRLEEQGLARQEVIDNLRLAKQNALYKADRKLTELTMQEYQQRAQVAQEWGTAIGTGLGEMIAGTEDAGKNLVKNLATMAVQSIGQMAQMYVAKQLLLSQQNMSEAAAAMTTATTAAAEATAVGAAKTAEATAIAMATPDSVLTNGASGAAKAAVISGLIAAAVAASIAIINSLFPGAGKTAEAKNRKLSTGMLTYAEGNYPVLGNDGKVYDAKYEGAGMKTGIYGGGAHFGIFSEKQPEMIVDGKTTQKLILNYPYIYDAITTIAKNGRLVNAMPTFASGDYPAGMNRIAQVEAVDISGGSNEDMIQMRATMEETREVNRQLLAILSSGRIVAHLDGLETHRQQKKNERFLNRRGIN